MILVGSLMAACGPAQAQEQSRIARTGEAAGRIASQPARDVGVSKIAVPPVLEAAIRNPYAPTGTASCTQLRGAIRNLNAALGPDFVAGTQANEDRASKIAEAGGRSVVNAVIPFRGLVREVSGAAPAQRRLNAAMDAGYARRGFLRGMATARRCRLR
ncbi:hypothetical protein [uncultured Sphingomonas sp.]|uniref:hypothetical protein n=1 Tax=uncultured Sphingomonas sp. TaxID=158754 RepID=UPI0025F6DC79|nr:hypothetical protein [uncultured Sphingomonas sp.]